MPEPNKTRRGSLSSLGQLLGNRVAGTQLSPAEERAFQSWVERNGITDVDAPESRYDYRGFWKKYPDFQHRPGEHFTDEFKLPGHLSFSAESRYATPDHYGGRWVPGTDTYMPQTATSRAGVVPDQLGASVFGLATGEVNAPVAPPLAASHATLADLVRLLRRPGSR